MIWWLCILTLLQSELSITNLASLSEPKISAVLDAGHTLSVVFSRSMFADLNEHSINIACDMRHHLSMCRVQMYHKVVHE